MTSFTPDLPTNKEVREELRAWQRRNKWQWSDVSAAMRAAGLSSVPGAQRLEAFAAAPPIHLHPNQLYIVRRFLTRFPNPPSAAELIERLGSKYMDQHEDARERGIREAIERERQREAYVRRLLEAERAPRCRPHREFMDKATVAALSGVRL